MMSIDPGIRSRNFQDEVIAETPGNPLLERCIQCGSCGGSCPSAADMDHTPRSLFALIAADMRNEVLESNAPWFCVSCYYCMARCPQEIHITDVMYSLKRLAIREGRYEAKNGSEAPDFSETFIGYVNRYGRSFELGLATRYHLKHHPLGVRKQMPMALELLKRGRLDLIPNKIRDLKGLQAILRRAREIGEAQA
jgi:heterodisulfide reductase subunit C